MVRALIWAQAVLAILMLVASLADRGTISGSLVPPEPVVGLGLLSAFILPIVVIVANRRRTPGTGRPIEVAASIGLAGATMFALFPMCQ